MSNVVKMKRTATPEAVAAMYEEIPEISFKDFSSKEGEALLSELHALDEQERERVLSQMDSMVQAHYSVWLETR